MKHQPATNISVQSATITSDHHASAPRMTMLLLLSLISMHIFAAAGSHLWCWLLVVMTAAAACWWWLAAVVLIIVNFFEILVQACLLLVALLYG
jgi:hypothetical protein